MRSFLSDHAAVDLFLQRATAAFEADCKEMAKQVDGQSVSVAVNLYSDLFPEILRLPTSNEATEVEIETVREFLVGCEKELGQLVSSTDKFVSVHHVGTLDLAKVASAFATLSELEKNFLEKLPTSLASQPIHPRCDINESLSAWQQSLKWSANAYDENLLAPFRFEHQDAQAMLEVFAGRKELQARHAKSVAKSAKWNQPGNAPVRGREGRGREQAATWGARARGAASKTRCGGEERRSHVWTCSSRGRLVVDAPACSFFFLCSVLLSALSFFPLPSFLSPLPCPSSHSL